MNREASLAGTMLAGRYDVLELLGSGGMGAVYRARDRELDEVVALKVIRSELAAQPAMVERFRREVKLARRVTHANVARTFELGVADGILFCTMELVDGESLTQRLARGRVLSLGEAVAIACAMCDALAAAHAADVIHRDIKPDNVLIDHTGRVVVADFGVAAAGATSRGELSGTLAYMAPEQARGERPTPAVDVYSVGVVLREMLGGQPGELGDVIARATATVAAERLQSASQLRRALEPWLRASQPVIEAARIADRTDVTTVIVLAPSGPEDRIYLAEAVHEELLARLLRVPRLRVLPRVGGLHERAFGVCSELVGNELAVEITHAVGPPTKLQLPLATDQLGAAADVIAAAITGAVSYTSASAAAEAHDLWLRARHMIQRDFTRTGQALDLLERARALAPEDARITASIAIAHGRVAFFRADLADSAMAIASKLARETVEAAPDLADAQLAAGYVELATGNPVAAARHFRIAIARAPLLADAHEQLGRMLLETGYLDDALARLEEAIAINPNLRNARWSIAGAAALEKRWDEHDRIVAELRAQGLDRSFGRARYAWWRHDWDHLREVRASMAGFDRGLFPGLLDAVFAIFLEGKWAEKKELVLAAAAKPSPSRRAKAFICQLGAEVAAFAGDRETSLAMLARASDNCLFDLHWLDRCPLLDSVRDQPGFATVRTIVKHRADAILDAVYGERDLALSETAIAT